jgi:hypothetical protein
MTAIRRTTHHIDTISSILKGLEQSHHLNLTGTGNSDHGDGRGKTKLLQLFSMLSTTLLGGIMATEKGYLWFKAHFLFLVFSNDTCVLTRLELL